MATDEVWEWAASEVARQGDSPLGIISLKQAWDFCTHKYLECKVLVPTQIELMQVAQITMRHAKINMINTRDNNYRTVPIIVGGSSCARPSEIPHMMGRWDYYMQNTPWDDTPFPDREKLIDSFTKQLLEIHPWVDGNGRSASLFYNWMMQSLDNPVPLPAYFEGEQ